MKTKVYLSFLLSCVLCLVSLNAQVPQGFNYQAIAKDGSNPIANQTLPVRITIQADSMGTAIIWQELHSSVTTNSSGLFTLILGKGSRQAPSNVAAFSDIDWSATPKFIKTEISYSGWKTMGVTRFWSVPYSLNTANVTGTLSKLSVKGKTAINDEALFEVKNKDGQTVFAVYNEGVRVYVSDGMKGLKGGFAVGGFGTDKAVSTPYFVVGKDSVVVYLDTNPLTKKLKGGFAVGGYDLTKGIVQDYLNVSSDSVRIYIDSNPATKKLKGGFAVGGYDMVKAGPSQKYMRVTTDSTRVYVTDATKTGSLGGFAVKPVVAANEKRDYFNITNAPAAAVIKNEPRVMWYSQKSALLGGEVHVGSADSVGLNSTALGYRSIAKGNQSQAFGYRSLAYGTYSTAIGFKAESNNNSMAVGYLAKASGSDAFALGSGALAVANKSFAFGSVGIDSLGNVTGNTKALGDYAYAFGLGSVASGRGSFSIGANDTASGEFSVALGYKVKSKHWYSTAIGAYTEATGQYSTSMGFKSKSSNFSAFSSGYNTTASGTYSTAFGYLTKATGSGSSAFGSGTQSGGSYSFAAGSGTSAAGYAAVAAGRNTTATGTYTTALGYYSNAVGNYSMAAGYYPYSGGTSSISLGYQTKANGGYSTAFGRQTVAGGDYSIALGLTSSAAGLYSIASGYMGRSPGDNASSFGYRSIARAFASFVIGQYNDTTTMINLTTWTLTDPLFVIGMGTTAAARKNAVTVLKNGMIGLQTVLSPTYALQLPNSTTPGIGQAQANAWVTYSDARIKSDQHEIGYGLKEILTLQPKQYMQHDSRNYLENGKTDPGAHTIGLIAQEVYDVLPEVVSRPIDADHLWGIDYDKMIPVLVKAIQEQQRLIDELMKKNEELDILKAKVRSLEQAINQLPSRD